MQYGYISPRRLSSWLHSSVSLVAERRLPGEGSIYQRESDGRWVGVVDLGWVGGKRVRKTVSAKTLAELRPKFKRLKQTIESGVLPDELTVEQWFGYWLDNIASKKNRESTVRTYRRYVDKWVVPHLGKRRLDRLKAEHLEALYQAMEDAGKTDATRRQVHAIIHRALKLAVQRRKVSVNVADHVAPPPVGQGSHGKFTLDEAKAILRSISDDPLRSRWVCALILGLRQGEALGLRWENVDFDHDRIYVDRAVQQVPRLGLVEVDLKSKAAYRSIPLISPAREILAFERQPSGYVWGGDKPTAPRKDWQAWKDMLEAAGVEHRALHAARATTGSLLLEAGVPPVVIAEILGHAQVQVTERHYLHGDDSMRRASMNSLEQLLTDEA